ncbi:MAG TPA: hypothetical protein VGM46_12830, partial [Mesorhizobium sp.]
MAELGRASPSKVAAQAGKAAPGASVHENPPSLTPVASAADHETARRKKAPAFAEAFDRLECLRSELVVYADANGVEVELPVKGSI